MRVRSLGPLLRNLLASGGILAGGARMAPGCCAGYDPVISMEATIDPRGDLAMLVARCRLDDRACAELCAKAFFAGDQATASRIIGCILHDRTPTQSLLHVDYLDSEGCVAGRRPPGLGAIAVTTDDEVGRWLATIAHLEAAAVPAFLLLARELVAHQAPAALVHAALVAADDEVRHARVMGALARAHGVTPPPVTVAPTELRDLPTLALDNATEGCVREAWAAACAQHQGEAAPDPVLAAALRAIARDEHRHAALSRALDGWLRSRLGPVSRRRAALARRDTLDALWLEADHPPAAAGALGWPDPARARALLRALPA